MSNEQEPQAWEKLSEDAPLRSSKRTFHPELFFSVEKFKKFLEQAVKHYQQSAPRLAEWLDDMYIRLGEDEWKTIALEEIQQIQYLYADDCWLGAEWAQNNIYRMLNRQGKDTAGFN